MSIKEQVIKKKNDGQKMTIMEKILYVRIMQGLGLKEASNYLEKTGNYFEGVWFPTA